MWGAGGGGGEGSGFREPSSGRWRVGTTATGVLRYAHRAARDSVAVVALPAHLRGRGCRGASPLCANRVATIVAICHPPPPSRGPHHGRGGEDSTSQLKNRVGDPAGDGALPPPPTLPRGRPSTQAAHVWGRPRGAGPSAAPPTPSGSRLPNPPHIKLSGGEVCTRPHPPLRSDVNAIGTKVRIQRREHQPLPALPHGAALSSPSHPPARGGWRARPRGRRGPLSEHAADPPTPAVPAAPAGSCWSPAHPSLSWP